MNNVILMGCLTRDPDIRFTEGDEPLKVAHYTLAVDSQRKKEDGTYDTDFIPCTLFGKQADFAEKFLQKGSKILASAHIRQENYTDKNGDTRYSTSVIVDRQEFAEKKTNIDLAKEAVEKAKKEKTGPVPGRSNGALKGTGKDLLHVAL